MDLVFETNRYCEGDKCNHPEKELRSHHKCPKCERIVHQQCSVFDVTLDKHVCNICANNGNEKNTTTEDINFLTSNNEGNQNEVMDMTVKVRPMIEEYTAITDSVK